jgi:glycerophosphoryl diester phosphodiesterase
MRTALLLPLLAIAAPALVPPSASAQNPWLERRMLNIAHQGGEDEFPSNTLYAFKRSIRAGADMLELDVGVTRDGEVVVMHDTTLNRTTSGRGTIASHSLAQVRALDAAYWFAPGRSDPYRHGLRRAAYRFRGVATGKRRPPRGYKRKDFRVPTLREVLRAFPHTPINVEIKGRTPQEATAEYVKNAEILARLLKGTKHKRLIVVSFQQAAVDRFHELAPKIDLAPGIGGASSYLLAGGSPGDGVVAFQVPITFTTNGSTLQVTTAENVAKAHADGYAWQNWFSNEDRDAPATWRSLIDMCVDGTMTSRPVAYERVLKKHKRPASCG